MVIKLSARRVDLDGMPLMNADLQGCTVSGSPLSAGGGGAWEFISSTTLSGTGVQVDVTSGYDYNIVVSNAGLSSSDRLALHARSSTTKQTIAYQRFYNNAGTPAVASGVDTNYLGGDAGTAANDTTHAGYNMTLIDPAGSGRRPYFGEYLAQTGSNVYQMRGAIPSGAAIDNIYLRSANDQTFTGGTICVWRRSRSA